MVFVGSLTWLQTQVPHGVLEACLASGGQAAVQWDTILGKPGQSASSSSSPQL